MSERVEPTDAQVNVAYLAMIDLHWTLPYAARADNLSDEEIEAGKMRVADYEAKRQNLSEIRQILAAAMNAEVGDD